MISNGLKITLSVITIAAVVAAVAAGVMFLAHDEVHDSYDIKYELNGGINSSGNPDSYSANDIVEFKTPTRDGYMFDGWFKDASFTVRIYGTDGLSEDLCIYAKWHQKAVYNITYVLNGGINSTKNPDTYLEDSVVMLSHPTKALSVFYGWHLKADFSDDRIDYISRYTDSDVTLYAQWAIDRSGYSYIYENSGAYKTPDDWTAVNITGSTTYTYLNYVYEKGYHLKCAEKNIVNSETTSTWTLEHDFTDWEKIGEEAVEYKGSIKVCTVYMATFDNGETWTESIANDGIIYKMTKYQLTSDSYGDTIVDMEYLLTDTDVAVRQDSYTVTIYNDEGIISVGSGKYKTESEVTLTASSYEGYTVDGWYTRDGARASSSETLYIEMLSEDIELFVKNTTEYHAEYDSVVHLTPFESLRNVTWTCYENGTYYQVTGDSFTHIFSEAGEYTITYTGVLDDGSDYHGMYRIICKGVIDKEFPWEYDSMQFKMILHINYNDYIKYRNDPTERYRTYSYVLGKFTFDDDHTKKFVVYDEYIEYIAQWFRDMKSLKGWNDLQTVNCILNFVQSIPYVSDTQSKGVSQYWKFPLETLYEQCGDDEDTSFLFCSILKAMNYRTALLLFNDHMAAAANVLNASGPEFVYVNGSNTQIFYYCETCDSPVYEWNVGDAPDGYTQDGEHYNQYVMGCLVGAVLSFW